MKTGIALLAVGLLFSGGAALAQDYPPEPPAGYRYGPPPSDWERRDWWRRMKAEERHEYWQRHRRAEWRCDHGDRDACHWLREHG